jgi:hypothetical protein
MTVTMAAAVERLHIHSISSELVASGLVSAQCGAVSKCHERVPRGECGAVVRIGGAPPRGVV